MRREERRDLPMEWMRGRDLSSSFRISNFGQNGYRGGVSLSLSDSLVLSSLLADTRKGRGRGHRKEERKEGRGKNDKGAPIVSVGNFAIKPSNSFIFVIVEILHLFLLHLYTHNRIIIVHSLYHYFIWFNHLIF